MCYYLSMYWLRAKIHPTWHFTALLLGFITGVAMAHIWQVVPWLGYGTAAICVGLALWRQRRMLIVLAFVGGGLAGLARGAVSLHDLSLWQPLYGHTVIVTGRVSDDTEVTPRGSRLRLDTLRLGTQQMPGTVFATLTGAESARRSDVVTLKGVAREGFGSFAASMTGSVVKIERPVPGDVALEIRDTFAGHVRDAIVEPQASLGIGYLLGQKSALPGDLADALVITGLTHIVVASGYNLTILVRIGRRLFAKISKYLAMLSGASLIVGFIAITGLSPSMTRAGLVAGLGLWAWYYGRKFHPVTLLALAAAVTVAVNPSYIWGDLGWLLSFAAFAGVMIVAPVATAYFYGPDKVPFVPQLLIETVAAQVATLPIMIMAFGQVSVIAPLVNLLILPLIPIIMLFVAIAGAGVWLLPMFAAAWGWLPERLLTLQVAIIEWSANIPWAIAKVEWQWGIVATYCIALGAAIWYMKWRSGYKLYTASIIE